MANQQRHYYTGEVSVAVDCDGIPAAIVTERHGEPLVLLVSAETLEVFNEVKSRLGFYTHIELANILRDQILGGGGQFHENSVMHRLQEILKQ